MLGRRRANLLATCKRTVGVLLRGECEDTAFSFEVPVGKGRGKEGSERT
jgi:hypothetical protein